MLEKHSLSATQNSSPQRKQIRRKKMAEEALTKKQKAMLPVELYLDLVDSHKNFVNLTVPQLQQILGMHGFKQIRKCEKKNLVEVVGAIELMNLRRSTLQHDAVSPCDCFTLEEVMKDLKVLDWQECQISSIHTQNAATSSANSAGVSVKRRKSRTLASVSVTGTTVAAGSTTTGA